MYPHRIHFLSLSARKKLAEDSPAKKKNVAFDNIPWTRKVCSENKTVFVAAVREPTLFARRRWGCAQSMLHEK